MTPLPLLHFVIGSRRLRFTQAAEKRGMHVRVVLVIRSSRAELSPARARRERFSGIIDLLAGLLVANDRKGVSKPAGRCSFTYHEVGITRGRYCSLLKGHLIVHRAKSRAHPVGSPPPLGAIYDEEAGFLATPAKIIRRPGWRGVEDFNLYRNAKRGFKRANNAELTPRRCRRRRRRRRRRRVRFRFRRTNYPYDRA